MRENTAIHVALIGLALLGASARLFGQGTPLTKLVTLDEERRNTQAQPSTVSATGDLDIPSALPPASVPPMQQPESTNATPTTPLALDVASDVAKEVADVEGRIYARYEESQRIASDASDRR